MAPSIIMTSFSEFFGRIERESRPTWALKYFVAHVPPPPQTPKGASPSSPAPLGTLTFCQALWQDPGKPRPPARRLHQRLVQPEDLFLGGLARIARRAHVRKRILGQRFQIGLRRAHLGDGGGIAQIERELAERNRRRK